MNRNVWDQLKNKNADELISALKRDGWIRDITHSSKHVYYNNDKNRRIVIHYHPKKTFREKLLKGLLEDTGWNEKDFKRLKLIK